MSLILDALKKVERDKGAGDPGVVVVTSVPWRAHEPGRRLLPLALLLLVPAAGLVGWRVLAPARPAAGASGPRGTTPDTAVTAPGDHPVIGSAAAPTALASRTAVVPAPAEPAAVVPAGRRFVLPRATRDGTTSATPGPTDAAERAPADEAPAVAAEPRPHAPAPRAADAVELTAISEHDGQRVAIVNDRLVHEGDSFGGIRVLRIGEAEVEVEVHGERRVLRF